MINWTRGDCKPIRFKITNGQTAKTPTDFSDVELTVGGIRRLYTKGEITYDTTTDPSNPRWQCILSQADTFSLSPGQHKIRVRVKFAGTADFTDTKVADTLYLSEAGSEEIL